MSIILDRNSRVLVQGVTNDLAAYHTRLMLDYGTAVVAGVTPGKGGTAVHGVPVFDTVAAAVSATGANLSVLFTHPLVTREAGYEALEAEIATLVCMAEGVPVHDTMWLRARCREAGAALIGPNSLGIASPGIGLVGFYPAAVLAPGPVGIVSKSGSLSLNAAEELTRIGIGQSTVVSVGGDTVKGHTLTEFILRFEEDPDTRLIVLLGEVGGSYEEELGDHLRHHPASKPILGLVVGRVSREGVPMGHAGALVNGRKGAWCGKVEALRMAGVEIAQNLADLARRARWRLAIGT